MCLNHIILSDEGNSATDWIVGERESVCVCVWERKIDRWTDSHREIERHTERSSQRETDRDRDGGRRENGTKTILLWLRSKREKRRVFRRLWFNELPLKIGYHSSFKPSERTTKVKQIRCLCVSAYVSVCLKGLLFSIQLLFEQALF